MKYVEVLIKGKLRRLIVQCLCSPEVNNDDDCFEMKHHLYQLIFVFVTAEIGEIHW